MIGAILCRLGRHKRTGVRWLDARHFELVCDRACGHVFTRGFAPIPPRAERRRLARTAGRRVVDQVLPQQALKEANER